jgi:hypothetical protein
MITTIKNLWLDLSFKTEPMRNEVYLMNANTQMCEVPEFHGGFLKAEVKDWLRENMEGKYRTWVNRFGVGASFSRAEDAIKFKLCFC